MAEVVEAAQYPNQRYGWVRENDGTWSLYAPDGTLVISSPSGRAQVSDPVADDDVANKGYGDANWGGGSVPGGLATYGDGSDGDLTVDSSSFNWPDLTGISTWQALTAYAVGDQVTTPVTGTLTNPRIYKCVVPGTSGSDPEAPFGTGYAPDSKPGSRRRGDRTATIDGTVFWEQVTAICDGQVEGPIFADNFTVDAGVTLGLHGWVIFAKTSCTVAATALLSGKGFDAVGDQASTTRPASWDGIQTMLGRGVAGAVAGDTGNTGSVWGGGVGGWGGAGADGAGGQPGVIGGGDTAGYTLGRFSPLTMMIPLYIERTDIGGSGGGGTGDTGGGKVGGGSGSAGSAVAIFAKAIALGGNISCKGGAGANGQAGGDTGGGGGGSGGCCVLLYDTKTGAGTVDVTGGTGGAGQGAGVDGGDGTPGDFVELANV